MPTNDTNNVSPLLLPGVILGGVLLLIGGISTGSIPTILLAIVVRHLEHRALGPLDQIARWRLP